MLFPCGNEYDFNNWANVTDDNSWNFENMKKHTKNIMNMHDPSLTEDAECSQFYGTEGNLQTGPYYNDEVDLMNLFEYAAVTRGYRKLKDINCGKWTGYTRVRGTIHNGERQTAAKAFLAPLRDRKNLMILQNAVVDRVIVNDSNEGNKIKVKGVRVVTKNSECPSFDLKAKKEIILSAGAFNTPLILQRSGIGRAADLAPFNIKQRLNLNVGHNYHDHLLSFHAVTIPSDPLSAEVIQNEVTRYLTTRQGLFSYLSTINFNVFLNHDDPTSNIPNNQWLFFTFSAQQAQLEQILKFHLEFKQEFVDQLLELNQKNALILFINTLSHPKSSGYVGLRSTDPYDEPNIDANFLAEEEDYQTMFKGIREIQKFVSVMQGFGAQFIKVDIPECNPIEYETDDYWRCYLKYFTQTEWHPSGTARMGREKDKNAVVNSRLKVIGVQGKPNLRVVDASVTPQVTTLNSQCAIYALSDRASQIIIEDNSRHGRRKCFNAVF
jgi:choline dehydrogenase